MILEHLNKNTIHKRSQQKIAYHRPAPSLINGRGLLKVPFLSLTSFMQPDQMFRRSTPVTQPTNLKVKRKRADTRRLPYSTDYCFEDLRKEKSALQLEHKTFALAINRDYFSTVFTSDHPCTIQFVYSQYTGGLRLNQHQKPKMARPINRECTFFML